ncbi:MAG: hypothetical protein KatS3mg060_2814 [Dehalococcoidia bacterium]|nr:MAG: hypothetical protein KatS3mg060_2814 [Dehalococcoidia bacterium]
MVREVFTIALTAAGCTVSCWTPDEPVLAFLGQARADAILLDLRLGIPQTGEEILIALRADRRFDESAIVVVTGDLPAAARLEEEAEALNIVVAPKPIGTIALRDVVERALALRSAGLSMTWR